MFSFSSIVSHFPGCVTILAGNLQKNKTDGICIEHTHTQRAVVGLGLARLKSIGHSGRYELMLQSGL